MRSVSGGIARVSDDLSRLDQVSPNIVGTPYDLMNGAGTLYFSTAVSAFNGTVTERGFWKSDGTDAGTIKLATNVSQNFQFDGIAPRMASLGGSLYFAGRPKRPGESCSEPTVLRPGRDSSPIFCLALAAACWSYPVSAGGKLYFVSTQTGNTRELWESDGTTAGTRRIAPEISVRKGSNESTQTPFAELNGKLYFVGQTTDQRADQTDGLYAIDPATIDGNRNCFGQVVGFRTRRDGRRVFDAIGDPAAVHPVES